MPDWEKRVRERIGPRMLTRESVENIIAELSAHLEDGYQNDLSRGLDESEASKRVRSGIQWIELAREIRRTTLKGESMNNRTKSLWLPRAVNLAVAAALLEIPEKLAPLAPSNLVKIASRDTVGVQPQVSLHRPAQVRAQPRPQLFADTRWPS